MARVPPSTAWDPQQRTNGSWRENLPPTGIMKWFLNPINAQGRALTTKNVFVSLSFYLSDTVLNFP
jgi:hypothetical protein